MKKILTVILAVMLVLAYSVPQNVFATGEGDTGGGTSTGETGGDTGGTTDNNKGDSTNNNSGDNNNSSKSDTNNNSTNTTNNYSSGSTSDSTSTTTSKLKSGEVSILFTGDINSCLDTVKSRGSSGSTTYGGGIARVAGKVSSIEQSYPDSFLFDAGNFSKGTVFQTLFDSNASELKALGSAGYDAVNLGQNEFGFGTKALQSMILKAKNAQTKTTTSATTTTTTTTTTDTTTTGMPYIVGPNVDWTKSTGSSAYDLQRALSKYGAASYKMITKEDTKIAVFGLMDEEAVKEASNGGVEYKDYLDYAQSTVKAIKKKKPDMIVCLANCGKNEKSTDGASKLASKVSDIDLIITSGTKEALETPTTQGDTTIVSAGSDTQYLGQLLMKKKSGKYTVKKYKLVSLTSGTAKDSATSSTVSSAISKLNSTLFSKYSLSYGGTLATNKRVFRTASTFGKEQREEPLGDLMSDAYTYASKKDGTKADVSFIAKGEVTNTLYKGSVTAGDVYNAMCTGSDISNMQGYDVVRVYLKGSELKNLAEIDASISNDMMKTRLYFSGLSYTVNEHRLKLNRATDIKLVNSKGETSPISNTKLYCVVCDMYFLNMLDDVMIKGHSMLKVEPKNSKGNAIASSKYENYALKSGGKKVKNWVAVSRYVKSQGSISQYYSTTHNRKNISTSFGPVALFKQANSFARIVYALILIPIVIIIGLIIFFRRRNSMKRGYSTSMFGTGRKRTKRYKSKFR